MASEGADQRGALGRWSVSGSARRNTAHNSPHFWNRMDGVYDHYTKYENGGGPGEQFQNVGKQGGGGATSLLSRDVQQCSGQWQSESQRARDKIQRTKKEGENDRGEERGRRGGELVRRTLSKMADSHAASNGTAASPGGMSNGGDGLLEPMKYIVVTGGVVSGLGKGVTISSIGRMLKNCGLRTTSIKIDPYLVGVCSVYSTTSDR